MSAGKNFFFCERLTQIYAHDFLSLSLQVCPIFIIFIFPSCVLLFCVFLFCVFTSFFLLFYTWLCMQSFFLTYKKNIHSSWITDFACALVNSSHENIIKLINWLQLSGRVMILHSTAYTFQSKFVTFKFMICQVEILYFHTLGMLNKI